MTQSSTSVVAHEQAHVERRDDWANLLQVVKAIFCGLHPAVWLINRELRREHEMAADDWVAYRSASARRHAECLGKVVGLLAAQRPPPLASGASGVLGDLARRVARLLDAGRNGAIRPARSALTFAGPMATLGVVWLSGLAPLVTFAAASGEPLVGSRSPSIQAAARVRTLAWDVVPEWVPIVSTEDRQQAPSGRSEPPADAASLSLVPLIRPPRLPAPRGWDIIPLAAREVVSQELLGVVLAIVSGAPSTAGVYAAALRRSRAESTDDSPTGRRAVSRFGTSVWVVVQRGWPADSGGFCWRRLRVQTYVHGAVSPVSLDAVNYCYETRGHDATTGVAGSEIAY